MSLSFQLYKISELPAKIKLSEWKLSSVSNIKELLTIADGQTFYLNFTLFNPIADNIFCDFDFFISCLNGGVREKKVLKR